MFLLALLDILMGNDMAAGRREIECFVQHFLSLTAMRSGSGAVEARIALIDVTKRQRYKQQMLTNTV